MERNIYENISKDEQIMLKWLQTALFDTEEPEQKITSAVFEEMHQQAVQMLVVDYLPKNLTAQITMAFVHNVQLMHEQDQVLKLLESNHIPVVILKGTTNAMNYPNPHYRSSGDIDLWVGEKDFIRAYEILLDNGYDIDDHGGLLEDIYEPNRKHVGFRKRGISFELHRQPFRVYDSRVDESLIMRFMEKGLYDCERGQLDQYIFPMLPPEQSALELLFHTKSHLRSGVGLRQIIDWMMFANKNLTDDKYSSMKPVLKRHKVDNFATILTRMSQMYLGLPEDGYTWARKADDRTCEALMVRILRFGNFGHKEGISDGTRIIMRSSWHFWSKLQQGGLSQNKEFFRTHKYLKPFA